jgi:hypothetical protein
MSWLERVKNDIIITTGDGREYRPLYLVGTKQVTYNIAEFNFPNVEGTLIRKGTPQGARYTIEIMFQGEDNIDVSRQFERSCANQNPWTIIHPMYDDFVCHPTTLTFDPSGLNTTRVTGTVIETILEDYPTAINDPQGTARDFFDEHLERMVVSFDNIELSPQQSQSLANANQDAFDISAGQIQDEVQFNEYFNTFNTANAAIINATSNASAPIGAVYRVITYPALFAQSVRSRLQLFRQQLNSLLSLLTPQNAVIYEAQAGACISGMFLTAVTPQANDYANAVDVLDVADIVVLAYNDYIANLDSLTAPDPTQPNAFIPNVAPLQTLQEGVFFTVSQLMTIALTAQQERTYILEEDSDVINITHRFYGLDLADENITRIIDSNNIGINEILEVKKGRKIVYYV